MNETKKIYDSTVLTWKRNRIVRAKVRDLYKSGRLNIQDLSVRYDRSPATIAAIIDNDHMRVCRTPLDKERFRDDLEDDARYGGLNEHDRSMRTDEADWKAFMATREKPQVPMPMVGLSSTQEMHAAPLIQRGTINATHTIPTQGTEAIENAASNAMPPTSQKILLAEPIVVLEGEQGQVNARPRRERHPVQKEIWAVPRAAQPAPPPSTYRTPPTTPGSNHSPHFPPTSASTSSHDYPSRAYSQVIELVEPVSSDPVSLFVISHGLMEYHAHILRSIIGIHTKEELEECKRMTTSTLDAVMGKRLMGKSVSPFEYMKLRDAFIREREFNN